MTEEVQEAFDDLLAAAREYLEEANGNVDRAVVAAQKVYQRNGKRYPKKVLNRSLDLQIKAIMCVACKEGAAAHDQ